MYPADEHEFNSNLRRENQGVGECEALMQSSLYRQPIIDYNGAHLEKGRGAKDPLKKKVGKTQYNGIATPVLLSFRHSFDSSS